MKKIENISSFRQKQFLSNSLSSRAIMEMLVERSKQAALSLGVGLLEEEVEAICGKPFCRKGDELFHRGGSEKTSLILDGAKYPFVRPRVRDDEGEVELSTINKLRDQDLLDEAVISKMMKGASTRNYQDLISAYSKKLGVTKSSVSRAFVRASAKDLDAINQADLSCYKFLGLAIDGVEFAGRTVVAAMGITETMEKVPIGIREGDTENAELVKDLLAEIMQRKFTLRCPKLFALIDGSKALKKALRDVFGEKVLIQRCWLHKLRNLKKYAPERYHKQIHWRMKKLMNLATFEDAVAELSSITKWLSEISHECQTSMEEVGEDLLMVHKLKLTGPLKKSLSTTNMIESLFSVVRRKTSRVSNWSKSKDQTQIKRWVAASIKSHQQKMRRLMGARDVEKLINALGGGLEIQQAIAL